MKHMQIKNKNNKTIVSGGTTLLITILALNLFWTFIIGSEQTVLAGDSSSFRSGSGHSMAKT